MMPKDGYKGYQSGVDSMAAPFKGSKKGGGKMSGTSKAGSMSTGNGKYGYQSGVEKSKGSKTY